MVALHDFSDTSVLQFLFFSSFSIDRCPVFFAILSSITLFQYYRFLDQLPLVYSEKKMEIVNARKGRILPQLLLHTKISKWKTCTLSHIDYIFPPVHVTFTSIFGTSQTWHISKLPYTCELINLTVTF